MSKRIHSSIFENFGGANFTPTFEIKLELENVICFSLLSSPNSVLLLYLQLYLMIFHIYLFIFKLEKSICCLGLKTVACDGPLKWVHKSRFWGPPETETYHFPWHYYAQL